MLEYYTHTATWWSRSDLSPVTEADVKTDVHVKDQLTAAAEYSWDDTQCTCVKGLGSEATEAVIFQYFLIKSSQTKGPKLLKTV